MKVFTIIIIDVPVVQRAPWVLIVRRVRALIPLLLDFHQIVLTHTTQYSGALLHHDNIMYYDRRALMLSALKGGRKTAHTSSLMDGEFQTIHHHYYYYYFNIIIHYSSIIHNYLLAFVVTVNNNRPASRLLILFVPIHPLYATTPHD